MVETKRKYVCCLSQSPYDLAMALNSDFDCVVFTSPVWSRDPRIQSPPCEEPTVLLMVLRPACLPVHLEVLGFAGRQI